MLVLAVVPLLRSMVMCSGLLRGLRSARNNNGLAFLLPTRMMRLWWLRTRHGVACYCCVLAMHRKLSVVVMVMVMTGNLRRRQLRRFAADPRLLGFHSQGSRLAMGQSKSSLAARVWLLWLLLLMMMGAGMVGGCGGNRPSTLGR